MSSLVIGVRYPGGTKRLTVAPTTTLKALKEQIGKEINESTAKMRLYTPKKVEFTGDSNTVSKLGISNGDLIVVDVPVPVATTPTTPPAAAATAPAAAPSRPTVAPATASAASGASSPAPSVEAPSVPKTCACRGKQRCLQCMPQQKVDTGYGVDSKAADPALAAAAGADSGDLRTAACKHGPRERCLNCRPLPGTTGVGFNPSLCRHGPGQKCSNCVTVPREEILALQRAKVTEPPAAPLPCNHGPGGKCINCLDKVEVDVYDLEYDPRKHCRHHGPHGSCTECLAALEKLKPTIRSQDSGACKRVDVAKAAAAAFGRYVHSLAFSVQRVGILYGTVSDDGVVRVEAIYEPPQADAADGVTLLADPDAGRVDTVAGVFGWKRVGWVFSHAAREIHMTAREVLQAARFQIDLGSTAVTLVVRPQGMDSFDLEAYQASDQAVNLLARGWLAESQPQPDAVHLAPGRSVVLQARSVHVVPTLYLICNVPITQHEGTLRHEFAVENRPHGQTLADYQSYMGRLRSKPFVDRVSDFHLLLFLSQLLSPDDSRALCDAVRTRNASRAEGFKYVISDLLGIAD